MEPEPADIFISYSHRDAPSLEELRFALRHLEREGRLDVWDDTVIRPGENWARDLRQRLDTARVIVVLLSPNCKRRLKMVPEGGRKVYHFGE